MPVGIREVRAVGSRSPLAGGVRVMKLMPLPAMLSLMSKSKSTPMRSKKLSLSVMKRTSIVTCRSCSRRNCSEKLDDLLVNLLRLADDDAQVRLERHGSSRGRRRRPRWSA